MLRADIHGCAKRVDFLHLWISAGTGSPSASYNLARISQSTKGNPKYLANSGTDSRDKR